MKRLVVLLVAMTMGAGLSANAYASLTVTSNDSLSNQLIYDSAQIASKCNFESVYQNNSSDNSQGDDETIGSSMWDEFESPHPALGVRYDYPWSTSSYEHYNYYPVKDGSDMKGGHQWVGFFKKDHEGHYQGGDHCRKLPSIPIPGALGLFGMGLAGLVAKKMITKLRQG